MSDVTQRKVIEAGLRLFARHGFQQTSMANVAREAQVSRATLYLRFSDKTALFGCAAESVVAGALAAAQAAWQQDASLATNINAALIARDLPLYRLLHASPHGAELLAVDADLTRAFAERLDADFAAFLSNRVVELPRADLSAFGGAEGFGCLIAMTGAGLKHVARSEEDYRRSVRSLAEVIARAVEGHARSTK